MRNKIATHSTRVSASLLASAAALVLAGCAPSPCDVSLANDQVTAANQVLKCIGTLDPTPVANMRTSGTATYSGFATGDIDVSASPPETVLADVSLLAVFSGGGGTISGDLSNFTAASGAVMSGSLSLSGGAITGTSITATVAGVLDYAGDTIDINAALIGAFFGSAAQAISGGITGTAEMGSGYLGSISMALFAIQ